MSDIPSDLDVHAIVRWMAANTSKGSPKTLVQIGADTGFPGQAGPELAKAMQSIWRSGLVCREESRDRRGFVYWFEAEHAGFSADDPTSTEARIEALRSEKFASRAIADAAIETAALLKTESTRGCDSVEDDADEDGLMPWQRAANVLDIDDRHATAIQCVVEYCHARDESRLEIAFAMIDQICQFESMGFDCSPNEDASALPIIANQVRSFIVEYGIAPAPGKIILGLLLHALGRRKDSDRARILDDVRRDLSSLRDDRGVLSGYYET